MADEQKQKWVLPPSLYQAFKEFITLYETLYKPPSVQRNIRPVLIMGPPGVGKTLFSEAFTSLYKEDNNVSQEKIVRINVAAFPETLIESILFGHLSGTFTGANKDKKGFVEEAAGGILILDEIGELSKEVQAKLLTFIEDDYYYKLGATKPLKGTGIQIIATTNKTPEDDVFRQDFIDRFFPFYIPPIYNRREDILYHWEQLFPGLMDILAPWEIMAIVAYHWPGNVREIERIGNLILWQKTVNKSRKPSVKWFEDQPLIDLKRGYTSFNLESCFDLYRDLGRYGIDIKFLQNELLKYRLALSFRGGGVDKIAFPKSAMRIYKQKSIPIGELMVENIYGCKYYDQAYKGLEMLCALLRKSIDHDNNLLDLSDSHIDDYGTDLKCLIKTYTKQHEKMVQSIHSFVEETASATNGKKNDLDIFKMTEQEMIEHYQKPYLEGLLKRTAGNQTKASKIAGLPLNTFRDHCKKYGLS